MNKTTILPEIEGLPDDPEISWFRGSPAHEALFLAHAYLQDEPWGGPGRQWRGEEETRLRSAFAYWSSARKQTVLGPPTPEDPCRGVWVVWIYRGRPMTQEELTGGRGGVSFQYHTRFPNRWLWHLDPRHALGDTGERIHTVLHGDRWSPEKEQLPYLVAHSAHLALEAQLRYENELLVGQDLPRPGAHWHELQAKRDRLRHLLRNVGPGAGVSPALLDEITRPLWDRRLEAVHG